MISKSEPYHTKIINQQGEAIPYTLKRDAVLPTEEGDKAIVILVNNEMVGRMRYSIKQHTIFIDRMDNCTLQTDNPLKHIGTVFFEYAFRKSVQLGKGGNVKLDAVELAPIAYYKMGFRKCAFETLWIQDYILAYMANPTTENAIELKEHRLYKKVLELAIKNSGTLCEELSLDKIIAHGFFDSYNHEFGRILAENTKVHEVPRAHIQSLYMRGIMCLPQETISELKLQWDTDNCFIQQKGLVRCFFDTPPITVAENRPESEECLTGLSLS